MSYKRIQHDETIRFFCESVGDEAEGGTIEERTAGEWTGYDKEEWDGLIPFHQSERLDEAHKTWLDDHVIFGWNTKGTKTANS